MLSTARSTCIRSLAASRPSWSLSLPAESSRQAAYRASLLAAPVPFRPVHAHARAPYSAEAIASVDEAQEEETARREHVEVERLAQDRISRDDSSTPPDPRIAALFSAPNHHPSRAERIEHPPSSATVPKTNLDDLPPLARFRYTLTTDPQRSLLALSYMSPLDAEQVSLAEIDTLLYNLSMSFGDDVPPPIDTPDDMYRALVRLHSAISNARSKLYKTQGSALVNKRFSRLLRACIHFGADALFQRIWSSRLGLALGADAHNAKADPGSGPSSDEPRFRNAFVSSKDIAGILTSTRRWDLALWLYHSDNMPSSWYHSSSIDLLLTACLATNNAARVPAVFDMFNQLGFPATAHAFCSLIQANLAMGDMVAARSSLAQGKTIAKLTTEQLEIAIMRGHMRVGGSEAVGKRVIQDVEGLNLSPSARLLNTLVRLNIASYDYDSGFQILERFTFAGGLVEPTPDTYMLMLKLHAATSPIIRLREVWRRLYEAKIPLGTPHLGVIVGALCKAGREEEAFTTIERHVGRSALMDWHIPGGLTLTSNVFALLLSGYSAKFGMKGVERVLRLMVRAGVTVDSKISEVLVQALLKHCPSPKEGLALLSRLGDRFPGLKPSIGSLDTIITTAINHYYTLSSPTRSSLPLSSFPSGDTLLPDAGLTLPRNIRRELQPLLQSLRARGVLSTSRTMSLRLQMDALLELSQGGTPSARQVWAALLARGFTPTSEHLLALIKGYAGAGAMRDAESVLDLARQQEIEPTPGMHMALLVGWARCAEGGSWTAKAHALVGAERAYKRLCACRVPGSGDAFRSYSAANGNNGAEGGLVASNLPDLPAMTEMVRAYHVAGKYNDAVRMVRVLIERFGSESGSSLSSSSSSATSAASSTKLATVSIIDTTALTVCANALRAAKRSLDALRLVEKYTVELTGPLRMLVRRILRDAVRLQDAEAGVDRDREGELETTANASESESDSERRKVQDGIREAAAFRASAQEIGQGYGSLEVLEVGEGERAGYFDSDPGSGTGPGTGTVSARSSTRQAPPHLSLRSSSPPSASLRANSTPRNKSKPNTNTGTCSHPSLESVQLTQIVQLANDLLARNEEVNPVHARRKPGAASARKRVIRAIEKGHTRGHGYADGRSRWRMKLGSGSGLESGLDVKPGAGG